MENGRLKTESYFAVMRTGTKLYFPRMYPSCDRILEEQVPVTSWLLLEHTNSIFSQHFQLCRSVWFIDWLSINWNLICLTDKQQFTTWYVPLNQENHRNICPTAFKLIQPLFSVLTLCTHLPRWSFTKDVAGSQRRSLPGSTRKQQLRAQVICSFLSPSTETSIIKHQKPKSTNQ